MVYLNPEELITDLRTKGWSDEEIAKTIKILKESPAQKTRFETFVDKTIFWLALLLLVAGNFAISVVLVPFMLVAGPIYIYPGIFFIALAFGKLFDIIIWDIEHIEDSTHMYPTFFLTAIAIINIYIMTLLNNQLASFLLLESHSPIAVALVYVSGFMLPHIYKRAKKTRKTPKSS